MRIGFHQYSLTHLQNVNNPPALFKYEFITSDALQLRTKSYERQREKVMDENRAYQNSPRPISPILIFTIIQGVLNTLLYVTVPYYTGPLFLISK